MHFISGNKGDTFFITIPNWPLTVTGASDSSKDANTTGATTYSITSNNDGSATITWTINQDGVSENQSVSFAYGSTGPSAYNDISKSPDGGYFWPATKGYSTVSYNGEMPDGLIVPISYGGSNVATQYNKITFNNEPVIQTMTVQSTTPNNVKKVGQNYNYSLYYSISNDFNNVGVATAVIDLPKDFVFDANETDYVQKNSFRTGIGVNSFKVLPGNKLQITIGGQNNTYAYNNGLINFVGHYDENASGDQTFNVESFDAAYLPGSDGKAPVIAGNGAETKYATTASDYNSGHNYAVPNTPYTETLTKDNISNIKISSQSINSTGTLLIGNTDNNVLANFSLQNLGNTTINPKYTITIPDGVESTGINLPLNQALTSNWPKDTTYNVTVNYSDGSHQTFDQLGSGMTVSSINGTDVQLMKTPSGAHVTSYVIEQSEPISPENFLNFGDIGNSAEAWYYNLSGSGSNDPLAYAFTVLGNVGTKNVAAVKDGQQLSIGMSIQDQDSDYQASGAATFTATSDPSAELTLGAHNGPSILVPGQVYTEVIGNNYGMTANDEMGINLNANGYRDSKGQISDQPSVTDPNDQSSYKGNTRSLFEPVIYITTPAQMTLVPNAKSGLPFTENGAGWNGVSDNPTITTFTNVDGLTVTKLDYTGTGFTWTPANQNMNVSFKVNDDATSALIPWNSSQSTGDGSYNGTDYVDTKDFPNSGLTSSNNAATKFGKTGESIAVVMVKGNQISNTVNTSQADLQNLYIQTADGQKITGLSAIQNYSGTTADTVANNYKLSGNFYISAPAGMTLNGTIQDNQGDTVSSSGLNKPVANDKQTIRLRLANNTPNQTITNVGGVINLPTEVTANDPNTNTQGKFALQMTKAATEAKTASGNLTNTYYSTGQVTLSSDGKYVSFADGHKYYFNKADGTSDATADDMMTADKVSDWSKVVGIVTTIASLAPGETADVLLPVKDPASATDQGKKVSIPTAFRGDTLKSVTLGAITDSFLSTVKVQNVDQNGNIINGYPETTTYGEVGSKIGTTDVPTIPGYVYTNNQTINGDGTISLSGNSTVTNHFQESAGSLKTVDRPSGDIADTAYGNNDKTNPNTGAATATGTNTITFTTTDADLAKGGSYTVTGPDSKTYATLADALKANSTFDQKSDATAPTQVFTVTYTKSNVNKGDVAIQNATKVYDGDASTDPVTCDVKLADGINAPTAGWVATDFDTTGIKSQDVGSYTITLSQQGLADLQKANASKNITMGDVTTGQFIITKAPITITAPSVTKVYDGKAYQGALTPAITGKPANGTDIQYTTTDISKDTDVGNYPINITATEADNPNYQITVKAGALTITPKDQTDAVVQGATKTYDGDATTDPTTYNVVLANGVNAPTWAASDFDTSGITSQNAGAYNVTLSAAGLKKLQDANPNYKITNANVIGGVFTITPAQVTVNAPYLTKIYDGKAYSGDVKATVAGKPAKGDDVKYTLGDLSKNIDAGTYDVGVTANAKDNPNYVVTVNPGKLFITPKGTYTPVIVQGTQKVYDNDATTDPATYGVELPDGITAPKWSADDFNTTGITSQNAGSYSVTLSDKGIADLQAANPNYHLASISAGIFTITKAPITITVPSVTKDYDGKPYSDKINVDVSGKPAKGDDVNYQLNDLSNDTEPGTYDIDATANNNPNYNVTVKNGKLIINDKDATDNYTLTVNYVEGDDNNKTISTSTSTLKDGADYSTDAKVIEGYYLKTTPSNAKGTIDKSNVTVTYIYGENGKYIITPPDGGNATDVVYPNDPKDPSKVVTPDKGVVPDKPGYTPVDPNGNPLTPVDPSDHSKGWLPPTVPSNPGQDTPIKYKNNNTPDTDTYTVTANYVDQSGNKLADPVVTSKVKTGDKYTSTGKVITGYYLTALPSNANGTVAKGDVTINYVYNKIGDYIITPPDGGKTTNIVYPNDPKDPTKVDTPTSGIVPNKPGYTPVDGNGNDLKPVDPNDHTKGYLPPTVPDNPSQDTPIYYHKDGTADTYHVTVNYLDQNGNQVAGSTTDSKDYNVGDAYSTTPKIVTGYHLTNTPTNASGKMVKGGEVVNYIYAKNGSYIVTPPDGGKSTDIIYPNDPTDPKKADTPTDGIIPNVPGYHPTDDKGNPLTPVDPNDHSKGYLPPTVPDNPSDDTPIKYVPDTSTTTNDNLTVNYVDESGNKVAGSTVQSYKDGASYTTSAKVINGYYLINTPTNASGTIAKGGNTVTYIYRAIGKYVITPPAGKGSITNVVYPNDPTNPREITTPNYGVVPYIPGYVPVDSKGNNLTPVDPNDLSKGYLPPTAPTAQPDLNTYITYKNTGSNNGGGSNNNGGGGSNNNNNNNGGGGSNTNGGGSNNNNGGTTPNGGNSGGNSTPSNNNGGTTPGKTTTNGDKVTKLTPTKGKTTGVVPTALTNRGNGTPTGSATGYNGGRAVTGGSSNGGYMTNLGTNGGNGNGQAAGRAGTTGTTQAAAGQTSSANTNANNGIQYPSGRLPQTGDAENKGSVILGVIGMLSTLGLAALRRKKREND